ncbi:peptidoglycan-binding protein [Lachnospiraceae bacterium ZAX-1]
MGMGFLKIQVHTGDDALPIADAFVTVSDVDGNELYSGTTDANGNSSVFQLSAPDIAYTLDPDYRKPAYTEYDVFAGASGFVAKHIYGVEVVDTQTAILPVNLEPLSDEEHPVLEESIELMPIGLLLPEEHRQAEPLEENRWSGQNEDSYPGNSYPYPENNDPENSYPGEAFRDDNLSQRPTQRILSDVIIPEYITVHLGTPSNSLASNVTVRFPDYIKNVVSSEIYSTWPKDAIEANIIAIVTFALNRIFTEWYRSRDYNFDITNSTAYDMYYKDGGQVFENISQMVDRMFNIYARRIGFLDPYFTQFCNGTTSTCDGLSQWGTVTLANEGQNPLEILQYYYTPDLELVLSNQIVGIEESYPGYSLRVGDADSAEGEDGEPIKRVQNYLNRIRVNFPLIPLIANPNGEFGEDTKEAVEMFQQTFDLNPDGIIGRDTWNKISFIFTAVARLAELDSEGIRENIGQNPPDVVLSLGARGSNVQELQFILNYISQFYDTVPWVLSDGVFTSDTQNAVREFQKTFQLTEDGIVGPATWDKLYAVYKGIEESTKPPAEKPNQPETPNLPSPPPALPYPGTLLKVGSTGANVKTMQTYLNAIANVNANIPKLTADGVFGNQTKNAVIQFQKQFSLAPDGIIGAATWAKIVEQYGLLTSNETAVIDYPGILLKQGSTGNDVKLMQRFLAQLHAKYNSIPLITADGAFGPATKNAVLAFQRLFGLTADGIIGPATWYEIQRH